MKKLALIYGLRLLPEDEIESVGSAEIVLKSVSRSGFCS